LELIYDLANRVNSGHNIYIIGDVFHITKANLNDKPYRDYTLGDNIISFKAKFDKKTAKSNRASAKEGDEIEAGYDASTGEPIRATVPKSNSTTLGENMMKIRYDGSVTRIKGEQTKTDVDKKLQNGVDNNEENSDKELVADLEILGDPALNINTIITLKGVAESHMGNWLITQVTHEISGKSSYITTCKLLKNGTIKPMTTEDTKSSNVNKKIPTKEAYYKIYYAPNKADEKIIPK
jgi:hypothetical protein